MILERRLEDWTVPQKGVAQIETSQGLWHIEASRVSDSELKQAGKLDEYRWRMEKVAVAVAVDTGSSLAEVMFGKAVEDRIEVVGSLVSPDRVVVGRIALGDRKSRASSVDGGSWAHQAEGSCESRRPADYLEALKFH
jgi:hypothetical protein